MVSANSNFEREVSGTEVILLVQDKLYIPLGSTTAKPLFKSLIAAEKRKENSFLDDLVL